jgi:acetyl-CoA C-acetyltransferase
MNMPVINDNTPVIVGVGFAQVTSDNPQACPEAIALMEQAIRDAASNSGAQAILSELESIAVQKGSWKYSNPGKLLADALGCPAAKTVLADLGVLQVMTFFELCEEIRAGRQQAGVVTGGESRYRELRSMITGVQVQDTVQTDVKPDVFYDIPDPFMSDLDDKCGVWAPGEYYALAESALRHHLGETLEQNRHRIANLYSGFSHVAAQNPHAWSHDTFSPEELLTIDKKNGYIAYPYSKRLMSQWNVNQSVAIIVCTVAKARALGIPESRWIFPLAAALNKKVTLLVQKPNLYTNPGTVLSGQRLFEAASVTPNEVDMAELYSPFASAVACSQRDLQLPATCPINISGSMAFAGGPFNHGGVDALARMAEVLRESPRNERKIGLVNNLSGMFGKHGCCLLSNQSGEKPYVYVDVSDEVAAIEKPLPLRGGYTGPARVVAYTVCFNKADISHAIVYCDLPSGERTVARCNDAALMPADDGAGICGANR